MFILFVIGIRSISRGRVDLRWWKEEEEEEEKK